MNLLAANQHGTQAQGAPHSPAGNVRRLHVSSETMHDEIDRRRREVDSDTEAPRRGYKYAKIGTGTDSQAVGAHGHQASTTGCKCDCDHYRDYESNIVREGGVMDADERGRLMHWLRGFAAVRAFDTCFVLKQDPWHTSEHGPKCSVHSAHSKGSCIKSSHRGAKREDGSEAEALCYHGSEAEALCDHVLELDYDSSPNNIIVLCRGVSAERMHRGLSCGSRGASLSSPRKPSDVLYEILQDETCYSFHVLW
jgi:hypothetical protein